MNFIKCISWAVACLVGATGSFQATSTFAGLFLDDYSSDTSANYLLTGGVGAAFDVTGGTLNVDTSTTSSTVTVSRNTVTSVEAGESVGVDVVDVTAPEGAFLFLSTAVSGGGSSLRWRRDASGTGDGVRFQSTGVGGFPIASATDVLDGSAATLWIDRVSDTSFEFQMQGIGASTRTLLGTFTHTGFAGVANLFFGVQAFNTTAETFAFDNLRVVSTASITIPEPSSVVLVLLAGVGLVGLRGRRSSCFHSQSGVPQGRSTSLTSLGSIEGRTRISSIIWQGNKENEEKTNDKA